ncbi:MAG: hypothetical protein KKA73_15870 [Chloroflexi bacterium]|nr:hypothetical protein [Chloroflexota bacterium]
MIQKVLASIVGVALVGIVLAALVGVGVTMLIRGGAGDGCEGCALAADCAEQATLFTLTGTVAQVQLDAESPALVLDVVDQSPVDVTLGTPAYLAGLGLNVQAGDPVTVTGHYAADEATLVAHVIVNTSTGQSFAFYDETGHPLWSNDTCEH